MKQKEIIIGNSYLFNKTSIPHRKDLEGKVVTIVSKKQKGKGKPVYQNGIEIERRGAHLVFKTSDDRTVAACELSEL